MRYINSFAIFTTTTASTAPHRTSASASAFYSNWAATTPAAINIFTSAVSNASPSPSSTPRSDFKLIPPCDTKKH
jgi:hypothetical protein